MGSGGSKFVGDAMLGSLVRKLRILGFDTTYHRSGTDSELVSKALRESRIILTSDRQLWSRHSGEIDIFLIIGRTERERLLSLKEQSRLKGIRLVGLDSRCALCNGDLTLCKKERLRERLPETILKRHRLFYLCEDCGKAYWKGRHWSRIRRYSGLLRSKRI